MNDLDPESFALQIVQEATDENGEPKKSLSMPSLRELNLAEAYLELKKAIPTGELRKLVMEELNSCCNAGLKKCVGEYIRLLENGNRAQAASIQAYDNLLKE